MPSEPRASGGRYWLLIGDVPSGPFDVGQVHAKLMAGEVSWQTQACPVGGSTWHPLVRVPGLGPVKPAPSEAVRVALPAPAREPLEAIPTPLPARPPSRASSARIEPSGASVSEP